MQRVIPFLLSTSVVLAHEGEAIETHSATKMFWDSVLVPNALWITGALALAAFIGLVWWLHQHGEN